MGVSSPRTSRGLHQSEGQQQDGDRHQEQVQDDTKVRTTTRLGCRHQEQVEDDTKVKDNNTFQGCHQVEDDIKVKDDKEIRDISKTK